MKNKMTKQEFKEKCKRFGVNYLGTWDGKHWAMKYDNPDSLYKEGGTLYELTKEFQKSK